MSGANARPRSSEGAPARPPRWLVGVTGGLAAVKTPSLVRRLREAGADVRVAATPAALRFVTPLALATAAGHEVLDDAAWFAADGDAKHLSLAAWADGLLVAPATADALARIAAGHAGDVVSALALTTPRVVLAPAMNPAMWASAPVRRNVARLRADGREVLDPASGAMGTVGEAPGPGRLPDEAALVAAVLRAPRGRDLEGLRVVVTAGPTREPIDPVRFLSNPSSGRMGAAVAAAARDRGAHVTLVHGPMTAAVPHGVEAVPVDTAAAMLAAARGPYGACDLFVATAAVADWTPAEPSASKRAKGEGPTDLRLVRTPDVLATLAEEDDRPVRVGFAMETDAGPERAAEKARAKRLAFALLNYPAGGRPGGEAGPEADVAADEGGFGSDRATLTLVTPDGASDRWPTSSKREAAERILDAVRPHLPG